MRSRPCPSSPRRPRRRCFLVRWKFRSWSSRRDEGCEGRRSIPSNQCQIGTTAKGQFFQKILQRVAYLPEVPPGDASRKSQKSKVSASRAPRATTSAAEPQARPANQHVHAQAPSFDWLGQSRSRNSIPGRALGGVASARKRNAFLGVLFWKWAGQGWGLIGSGLKVALRNGRLGLHGVLCPTHSTRRLV